MQKVTLKRNSQKDYDLSGDLKRIKNLLAETTYDAKGKASDLLFQSIADVKNKSTEVQDNVSTYVVTKPIKSIGIAVLAGMLIGFLIRK